MLVDTAGTGVKVIFIEKHWKHHMTYLRPQTGYTFLALLDSVSTYEHKVTQINSFVNSYSTNFAEEYTPQNYTSAPKKSFDK